MGAQPKNSFTIRCRGTRLSNTPFLHLGQVCFLISWFIELKVGNFYNSCKVQTSILRCKENFNNNRNFT